MSQESSCYLVLAHSLNVWSEEKFPVVFDAENLFTICGSTILVTTFCVTLLESLTSADVSDVQFLLIHWWVSSCQLMCFKNKKGPVIVSNFTDAFLILRGL